MWMIRFSLILGLLVSGLHLFALATYGGNVTKEDQVEDEPSQEHFQTVKLVDPAAFSLTRGIRTILWLNIKGEQKNEQTLFVILPRFLIVQKILLYIPSK